MAGVMMRKTMSSGGPDIPPPPPPPPPPSPSGGGTYISSPIAVYQMPSVPMPAWRGWFTDPVFGSTITRISDLSQATPVATGVFGVMYEYATQCAISKNGTWVTLFTRSDSSSGHGRIYSVATGAAMSANISPSSGAESEFIWDQNDDNVGWFLVNRRAYRVDMPSGVFTLLWTITRADGTNYSYLDSRAGGGPSWDNRWHSLVGYQYPAPSRTEWIMYDRLNLSVRARRAAPHPLNACMTTPLTGQFVAVGEPAIYDTELYDRDLNFVRSIHRYWAHGCLCVGSDGEEYYIYPVQLGVQVTEAGFVGYARVRLSDGARAQIPGSANYPQSAIHLSGQHTFTHPDWVLMSHYSSALPSPFTRPCEHEVWFLNFMTGEVKRIAHTHNDPEEDSSGGVGKDYWGETQACASWDGNRIMFKSNWLTVRPNKQMLTYMITGNFW